MKQTQGKLFLVVLKDKQCTILEECHDQMSVGHQGAAKSIETVLSTYWWPAWWKDTIEYVQACPICQAIKSNNTKKKRLLQPLSIPTTKWERITTDLVTYPPEFNGCTVVVVFVDTLTKYKFSPTTKEVTAKEYACLCFDNVVYIFGPSEDIVSIKIQDSRGSFGASFFA